MNHNPIIIIDDDNEDIEIVKQILKDLKIKNKIIHFNSAEAFLEHLRTTSVRAFFILCDINMGLFNGLDLRHMIFEDPQLRKMCAPFIFLTERGGSKRVIEAFTYGIQGYFVKPTDYHSIREMLLRIINYWSDSKHPHA